jgi:hypothetical protein
MRGALVVVVSVFDQLDFWRGVGRLLVDLALVVAMFLVVMSVSGHPVIPLGRASSRGGGGQAAKPPEVGASHEAHGRRTDDSTEHLAHLDRLAALRQSLELQGATVVLIVFAVILLGFNRLLGGPEVSTILAGITGYVLGTRSQTAQAGTTQPLPPPAPSEQPPASGQPPAPQAGIITKKNN